MFGEPMFGEALRPPARRRSADEQKFWSDIRVDGSGKWKARAPTELLVLAQLSPSCRWLRLRADHGRVRRPRRTQEAQPREACGRHPDAGDDGRASGRRPADAVARASQRRQSRGVRRCGSSLPIGTPHCEGRGGQGAGAATRAGEANGRGAQRQRPHARCSCTPGLSGHSTAAFG